MRLKPVKPEPNPHGVQEVPFASEGDIDKNLKDIGQHLKKFNDTLASLQKLGIHHDTPLPELILVGDQSSGKSSLMSAISQIILPRAEGVCTRCPIHIRLSSDESWRCQVTLQQDYVYRPPNDEPITESDVTEMNPFPPWVKQERVLKEFKMLFDKSAPIEEIVRWAQIAILNPNSDYKSFVPDDQRTPEDLKEAEEQTEAKFSPNTVAIEVKGPNLPDLSFYDMPGVFRNAKHEEDQFLVKVVENLVRSYVSHSKAIIIWAVPMNQDPETSSTFTLIRNLRAQDRTIGVMTKADLLPDGGHAQWIAMLRRQTHTVGRGYFITSRKQASDRRPEHRPHERISLKDESAAEEAFFNRRGAGEWSQEFDEFSDKCGIDRLVKFLAQTLAQEFARNLPDLSQKLHTKFRSTQTELSRLPDMPQNPEHEVRKSLFKFTADFQTRVKSKRFTSAWAKTVETFKIRILDLKPRYRLIPENFKMAPRETAAGGASDSASTFSMNNSPSVHVSTAKRPRPIDLTDDMVASQRRKIGNGTVKSEFDNSSRFQDSPIPFPGPTPNAGGRVQAKSLSQIRNLISSERESGKPGEVPYEVKEALCIEAIKPWLGPLHSFLNDTMKLLQEELIYVLNHSFKELKKRQVYIQAKKLTTEFLNEHKARILEQVERIYKHHTVKVYTVDEETFRRHRAHESHLLKRHRHFFRWKAYIGDNTHENIELWENMTAESRRKEEEKMLKDGAKLGEDAFELEIGVAAHVRGYYLTAANRFVDTIAMHFTCGLFGDLEVGIEHYLDHRLGLDQHDLPPDFFQTLMEEQSTTAVKRNRLRKDLDKFGKAMKEISDLNKTVVEAGANANGGAPQQEDVDVEDADGEYLMVDGDEV